MIGQARSILGPPETTSPARSTLGPRAAPREWATNILATSSAVLDRTRGWAGQRLLPRGPRRSGAPRQVLCPALRLIPWLPPAPSSAGHSTGSLHRSDLRALPPHCCYSSPHRRTHHGAEHRCWTRRPGATVTVPDRPSPVCSREPFDTVKKRVFRLFRKFCPRGTGSPAPPLNGVDPTPRRGEETQDVRYRRFPGC